MHNESDSCVAGSSGCLFNNGVQAAVHAIEAGVPGGGSGGLVSSCLQFAGVRLRGGDHGAVGSLQQFRVLLGRKIPFPTHVYQMRMSTIIYFIFKSDRLYPL